MIYLYIAIGVLVLAIVAANIYLTKNNIRLRKLLRKQSAKKPVDTPAKPAPKPRRQQEIFPSESDAHFLLRLDQVMQKQMSNSDLTIDQLADEMMMGRTSFFLRLKRITGLSPVEYIREARLKKATQILRETDLSITDIAHQVGWDDNRYFAKCFKNTYGVRPSEYREKPQQE